ncbi:MAG: D-alanyl-D-alanine carboxypeptidase/D-alanyl-D-alanine-endopeptidase [bacterium]|nr:D-alanyl-D-alanine carboxypeptidase/D-alanyl-D-alanine-endopeptidase [bacterium]
MGSKIERVISGYNKVDIGIQFVALEGGQSLYARNADKPFTPASLMKILTATAALETLGSEFQIPTEVFMSGSGKNVSIYIRGYGDPGLVSRDLWDIAEVIAGTRVEGFSGLYVDDSLFLTPRGPSGPRPYEAGSGALSLNHNCIPVSVAQNPVDSQLSVWTVPGFDGLLRGVPAVRKGAAANIQLAGDSRQGSDFSSVAARALGVTGLRVGGTVPPLVASGEVVTEYRTVKDPGLYLGVALMNLLQRRGVSFQAANPLRAVVPQGAKLIHTHQSKPLAEIIKELNFYSNNFIAEQLLNLLGQNAAGQFDRTLGLTRLSSVVKRQGFADQQFKIADGSGLDRGNRLTPRQIVAVLKYASGNSIIAPHFKASLGRFGSSGTVRKRRIGRNSAGDGVEWQPGDAFRGKTGTLTGVSGIAGYGFSHNRREVAYVVLVSGGIGKSEAVRIEDQVLQILAGTDI